jgi:hypothetical protein
MRLIPVAILFALLTVTVPPAAAQGQQNAGSIVVKGRNVKSTDKTRIPLARKRFYLFAGGLRENQALLDRLKSTEITSRDCFYVGLQASPCFISWLKEENCESPFCRAIKREDIPGVKEFETAYAKGLAAYRNKPDIALTWILNNLPSDLVTAYYRYQRSIITKVLAGQKPLQTSMTTSGAEATFPGVPVAEKSSKYLISNILPVEIDGKSYVWACEIDVQANKLAALPLALPIDPKRKNCVLFANDLRVCSTQACAKK